jgi:hypothetical protein
VELDVEVVCAGDAAADRERRPPIGVHL